MPENFTESGLGHDLELQARSHLEVNIVLRWLPYPVNLKHQNVLNLEATHVYIYMYMYIYIYIYCAQYIYIYVCIHICIYTYIHIYIHTCMHACMYVRTYVGMFV